MAKGGDSLAQTVVELVADPSGIKAGTDQGKVYLAQWAKVVEKLPGADTLQKFTGEWKSFMAGIGTAMIASKAIDWAKGLAKWAAEGANEFSSQVREANKLGMTLGVTAKSLFELRAASKGADFDDLTKFILRYNRAAADSKRASEFLELGLSRVGIQGDNAVETVRNLARALEGMSKPKQQQVLGELLGITRPEQLIPVLNMLEGGAAGFDKRLKFQQEIGLIPTDEFAATQKSRDAAARVRDLYWKGAKAKAGQWWAEKAGWWQDMGTDFMAALSEGWLGRSGPIGLIEGAAEASKKRRYRISAGEARQMADDMQSAELAAELAKEQEKYLDALRKATDALMAVRSSVMKAESPAEQYAEAVANYARALNMRAIDLDEFLALSDKAKQAMFAALGGGPTGYDQFRKQLDWIRASGATGDVLARMLGALTQNLPAADLGNRLPAAMLRGSAATESVETRYRMGLDSPQNVQERIRAGIDELKRIAQEQLEAGRDAAAALKGLGLVEN